MEMITFLRFSFHQDVVNMKQKNTKYTSGTVNSKSFVGKVLLRIEQKFELNYTLLFEFSLKLRIRNYFELFL